MKITKVYVVQKPVVDIDVTPASRFGTFQVLLPRGDVVLSTEQVIADLREGLVDFGDEDHLLLTGDPVAVGMAMTVAASFNQGRVKVLRWMKREKAYLSLALNFKN